MLTSYCSPTFFAGPPKTRPHRNDLAIEKTTSRTVIICRTNDEVNADLVYSWCDSHGVDFQRTDQRDELFPAEASAIAIDLNHLSFGPKERSQFIERLCRAAIPYPVAVASYDLNSELMAKLRARGISVFRRIEPQLLYRLVTAVGRGRAEFAA